MSLDEGNVEEDDDQAPISAQHEELQSQQLTVGLQVGMEYVGWKV